MKSMFNYKEFIKEKYNEYKGFQDKNLLFYQRLSIFFDAFKQQILLNDFISLNNFLFFNERNIDKSQNLKINDNDIIHYYIFYANLLTLPLLNNKISINEIINILQNEKIQNEKLNDVKEKSILINNLIFNTKYIYYLKNIIILLLNTYNHCKSQINILNKYLQNYYILTNEMIEKNIINIQCYKNIKLNCKTLLNSLYEVFKIMLNNI